LKTDKDFLDGQIILLDKPLDWTSFQAVNKLKYKLKKEFNLPKKFKIGHAGTLDPRATGLLIVCTGKFTKKIPEIQDAPKEYLTEIKIGVQTESYDTEKPEILHQDFSHISMEFIHEVLEKFVGEIEQKPPIFSAIKIDGKRAYDLARKRRRSRNEIPKKHHSLFKRMLKLNYLLFVLLLVVLKELTLEV
jgi:tRNA pseudouridine synthase B (EC 4.2.1.70)